MPDKQGTNFFIGCLFHSNECGILIKVLFFLWSWNGNFKIIFPFIKISTCCLFFFFYLSEYYLVYWRIYSISAVVCFRLAIKSLWILSFFVCVCVTWNLIFRNYLKAFYGQIYLVVVKVLVRLVKILFRPK